MEDFYHLRCIPNLGLMYSILTSAKEQMLQAGM